MAAFLRRWQLEKIKLLKKYDQCPSYVLFFFFDRGLLQIMKILSKKCWKLIDTSNHRIIVVDNDDVRSSMWIVC